MSIEDDIARVNAVTAKLAGPLRVWVVTSMLNGKVTPSIHFTKELALECLRHCLRNTGCEDEWIDDALLVLASGDTFNDGDIDWQLHNCEVHA